MMQNWGLSTEEPLVKGKLRRGAWQNYNTADEITMPVLQISLPFPKQLLGVFGFWVWKGCLTPLAQMTWYKWPLGSFLIDLICKTTFVWIKESSGEEEASLDQWCCHIHSFTFLFVAVGKQLGNCVMPGWGRQRNIHKSTVWYLG